MSWVSRRMRSGSGRAVDIFVRAIGNNMAFCSIIKAKVSFATVTFLCFASKIMFLWLLSSSHLKSIMLLFLFFVILLFLFVNSLLPLLISHQYIKASVANYFGLTKLLISIQVGGSVTELVFEPIFESCLNDFFLAREFHLKVVIRPSNSSKYSKAEVVRFSNWVLYSVFTNLKIWLAL